jgi:hypothetical protein
VTDTAFFRQQPATFVVAARPRRARDRTMGSTINTHESNFRKRQVYRRNWTRASSFEDEPGRRSAAKLLTRDEVRRIAANVAKQRGSLVTETPPSFSETSFVPSAV